MLFSTDCGLPAQLPNKLYQLSVLPYPHQCEGKISLCLFGHSFFKGVCVQFAHQLRWTMWFPPELILFLSPGRVQFHLVLSGQVSSRTVQVDRGLRFCVHKSWCVQDVPETCKTHFAVLCIVILLF
jgi:hypothetical protein